MIVGMKKIVLVVQEKDATSCVHALREMGAVHIEHVTQPEGDTIATLGDDIRMLHKAIGVLENVRAQVRLGSRLWQDTAREIMEHTQRITALNEQMHKRHVLINQWEPWGSFEPQDIQSLAHKGVHVYLCEMLTKELPNIPGDAVVKKVFASGGMVRCVVVAQREMKLPGKVLQAPRMSLADMCEAQIADSLEIKSIQREIVDLSRYKKALTDIFDKRSGELTFQEVLAGMGKQETLVYLSGFCPEDAVWDLKGAAQKENWAIMIQDPGPDDKVPTLLRNPRWVEMIKPVFSVMNILPGYREVDISMFFLLFFSVFFGMLIGDAGYGLIFLLLTFITHRKLGGKIKESSVFFLMYLLSGCAVIWGVLTGTFFGQAWLAQTVRPLLPWLRNNENMISLCFLIGAVHLSIAHIWRAIMKMPSVSAIAEAGWLSLLWGMYGVAKMLIVDVPLPAVSKILFVIGPALIILFSRPQKSIAKTLGSGLGDLALNLINTFTDVVSYVRLFAVGLATVAVADAFNAMALDIGFGSFAAGIITALILIAGHLLNIVLGAMAILVHGVRLNVLEFSSHLNMEWSGVSYNPFRRTKDI